MDYSVELSRVEQFLGRGLSSDEIEQYQYWRRGRAVAEIQASDGFAIMLETLGQEVDEANAALAMPLPHDEDLRAAHAYFCAANNLYQSIRQKLMVMVERSAETPDFVKQAYRQVEPIS